MGADCPKSSSVTAYDAEWMRSSPIAARWLSTAVLRMPPAQKPMTLTSSAPVTSRTTSIAVEDPLGVGVEVPVGLLRPTGCAS